MAKEIDITKNGHNPIPTFKIKAAGRINSVTPDGSNWEIRVHCLSDLSQFLPGEGLGEEIIGEVIIRSFNGGIAPLVPMAVEYAKTAQQLVEKIMRMLGDAERQKGNLKVVSELPPNLKGN